MASFKNISAALKDSKRRTLLVVVGVIVVIALIIGWIGLKRSEQGPEAIAKVQNVPGIVSTPGVGEPSREYVKTQEQENILKAQQAAREGTSSLPVLTRTTYTGQDGLTPLGTTTPVAGSTSPDCSPDALARARQAGVKAEELRCKGCSPAQLRAVGYSAGELMNAGFAANELKAAGFGADDLRIAGFNATELTRAGYLPAEMITAGFAPSELMQAGVGEDQLTAAGLSSQQVALANSPRDCSVAALQQARAQGLTAAQLRQRGCGATALKAAGFSAADLRNAGFSAGDLRAAGFAPNELLAAGFSATELRDAGENASDLAVAGIANPDLKAAGFTDGDLARAGVIAAVSAPTATTNNTNRTVSLPSVTGSSDEGLQALQRMQERQAEQLSIQERQDRITQLQQGMSQQAGDLFTLWSPPPTQRYTQGEAKTIQVSSTTLSSSSSSNMPGYLAASAQFPPIPAGKILFAVLDTAVNTDEPSPVLATIVSEGPFKGAKLMAQFPQRVDKKAILTFTAMTPPAATETVAINAVAIDPDTARTAIADNVDNHYLQRYGSLFAASFIRGYAKATEESGSTTTTSINGIVQTSPDLSAGDKAIVGLGDVGTQFANSLGSTFTRPPTVYIAAGKGIGILFMNDVGSTTPTTVPNPPASAAVVSATPAAAAAPVTAAASTAPAASRITPTLPSLSAATSP